jgi:hypothetical protein
VGCSAADATWEKIDEFKEAHPKFQLEDVLFSGEGGSVVDAFVGCLQQAQEEDMCLDWACSPMVGRSGGTLPTRVQILVLAPSWIYSGIFRGYALSGKRRSRRRRGASGDFENLQICRAQSFGGAHRGRVCVCVFIGVSECACVL